jgi:hypothetical protein
MPIAYLIAVLVLLNLFIQSTQQQEAQPWRNEKIVRQWQPIGAPSNDVPSFSGSSGYGSNQPSNPGSGGGSSGGGSSGGGTTAGENLISGISYDCSSRPTGPNRDPKYCDIFHACVFGKQEKTYSCPPMGERTYFDESTRRCAT